MKIINDEKDPEFGVKVLMPIETYTDMSKDKLLKFLDFDLEAASNKGCEYLYYLAKAFTNYIDSNESVSISKECAYAMQAFTQIVVYGKLNSNMKVTSLVKIAKTWQRLMPVITPETSSVSIEEIINMVYDYNEVANLICNLLHVELG